ncbi:S28 family serine protease [Nocardioides panacisoli]|uniref:S28 family serine protease n=1 Tax=Nocardioides panacisoli TaxID=627624 RepID=A0ABP7I1P9_9ACTN
MTTAARGTSLLLTLLTALALVVSPAPVAAAHPSPAGAQGAHAERSDARDPLLRRIRALPIVERVREVPRDAEHGSRFFRIWVSLPVDPADPDGQHFSLRATLVHVGLDRPTVLYASGYNVYWDAGFRGEVAQLVDGNQLSVEYRFFQPSRPRHPDWPTQLTISKAAADQHRIVRAFQRIYRKPWLSTGASKGGMTMTYLRRFHPGDVAGTVAYVAPDDADNDEDSAYGDFLASVGGDKYADCRAALVDVQRRILTDRDWFDARLDRYVAAHDLSLDLAGDADHAVEEAAIETYWAFWQYQDAPSACDRVPGADASHRRLWDWVDEVEGWWALTDQGVRPYVPYYFQAASQLGWPQPYEEPVADLVRYPGFDAPESYLPRQLRPVRFHPAAMADIDDWVRHHGRRMLFVYGALDPWGAERFDCGPAGADRQCSVLEQPGGNHGADVLGLPRAERRVAVRQIRAWAGLTTSRADVPRIVRSVRPAPSAAGGRVLP